MTHEYDVKNTALKARVRVLENTLKDIAKTIGKTVKSYPDGFHF